MDIHRCRFVQYPPHPINALAFSHSSNPKKKAPPDLRLALGRNNGDIEIWNPENGLWVQETILRGSKNTTIEQLAWTQDLVWEELHDANAPKTSRGPLRLFSTGGSTSVTEWDLNTGAPRSKAEGNFGDIWCFAAQPQLEDAKSPEALQGGAGSQLLAAGCSDGTIVLFSTEDDDLRYLRPLAQPPVKKPKVLSLVWRDRKTLVAGYEDSTIRVIDVSSRRILRNMSLGKPIEGNNSVVWTVKCLPDGTIVSGDSSGELKIWDPENYSLVQRLKSHKADVLDIAMSASGDMIFSVGVDRRTVAHKLVPLHSATQKMRWAEVSHKRYHQHDVKCASSFESTELSTLVTGGMDARPVVVPIRRSQTEYHRALSHLPQRSQISASKTSRMFISWWDREIVVYHVRKFLNTSAEVAGPEGAVESCYDTLTRLVIQDDESIQDAQMSRDGRLIAAATSNSVKLFQLRKTQVSGKPCLRTRQIELPPSIARLGARGTGFSPDGKWLYCVRKDNAVVMIKLIPSDDPKERPIFHEKIVKLYRQPRKTAQFALGNYLQTIKQLAFSTDSRVLAVGDLSGAIDVWVLEGHEDVHFIDDAGSESSSNSAGSSSSSTTSDDEDDDSSSPIIHGQKWIRNPSGSSLPQLDCSILALTFRPSHVNAKSSSSGAHDNRGLHATRHNPHPVSHELPDEANAKLIAVTAKHQVVEFDIFTAKLSDWSRRNPSRFLPHDFTKLKDRVVGCFWDCTDRARKGERFWLYGSTWIFMFDVSRDLLRDYPNGATSSSGQGEVEKIGRLGRYEVVEPLIKGDGPNRKRQKLLKSAANEQRERDRRGKKRKRNTGAGDQMRLEEREGGIGNELRKFKNASGDDAEMVDLDIDNTNEMDLDDELDEDGRQDDSLALMRRGEGAPITADEVTTDEPATGSVSVQRAPRMYWSTFEYQSILGIEVIGSTEPSRPTDNDTTTTTEVAATAGNKPEEGDPLGENTEESSSGNIEVIIVERPMHDVGQGPRFDGGQEWDV
ncbi:uncharacterized protein Z520_08176 [Fonsecaea multimorphosa CBS 102226]|uniref:Uncharacterized protein n=1 Tax=Fonsecaea multimorphosa CBS 102226 TaxID=1442371 RepID=A0A0D2IFT7_9EURO|nr:uncharacterized protein Z520_08176 [Fonsecaea multimorphosa CBS 102226]KIX95921.1 hypothetical protein Z520_08176 [Fonsecaea multimorphosa CBS 102226]OAL21692.1 hypothetical protein AYO22_07634 [Fonsecaea multimorphosa]